MSTVECLREFFIDRLTAAAEEIFGVFKKTIVEYEEEIDRQRKLLDIVWKGDRNVHGTELPQQHVCEEADAVAQLCDQERTSSLDHEDPEPPQIKEEQEELCSSQGGDTLVVKVETDTFITPAYEESDHSESEPRCDHQLISNNYLVAETQDRKEDNHGASGSSIYSEAAAPETYHNSSIHSNNVYTPNWPEVHFYADAEADKRPFKCYACGKAFNYKSNLNEHLRIHTGAKPYLCKTCGKRFCRSSDLNKHTRVHTGEKPYICDTCGKRFCRTSDLNAHIRTHTGERPYSCETCGKDFSRNADLTIHIRRAHTGEKPYLCKICGNRYFDASHLAKHTMRSHKAKKR